MLHILKTMISERNSQQICREHGRLVQHSEWTGPQQSAVEIHNKTLTVTVLSVQVSKQLYLVTIVSQVEPPTSAALILYRGAYSTVKYSTSKYNVHTYTVRTILYSG